MRLIYLLFLGISLGTLTTLSAAGVRYELKFAEIILLLIFLVTIIKNVNKGIALKITTFDKTVYLMWFAVFMYSMLIFFWSSQPVTALSGSIVLFFALIALFVGNYYIYKNPNIFITANRILVTSLFIQLLINMSSVLGAYRMNFYAIKENSYTLLGGSNAISFYFTFVLLYEFIAREKRWFLFSSISALGVVLTISRGAMVTLAICVAIYFLVALLNKNFNKLGSIISIGVMGTLFFIFIKYTGPGAELWRGLQHGLQASSVGSRELLWNQSVEQIKTNIMGNGVIWENDPHNIVLRSFRDFGVLFGTVFLILISHPLFYFLKLKTYRYSKRSIAILIAYLSVFIHALIEIFYLTSVSIIWTMMALSFLNATIRRECDPEYTAESVKEVKKKRRRKRYKLVW